MPTTPAPDRARHAAPLRLPPPCRRARRRRAARALFAALATAVAACGAASAQSAPQPRLPTTALSAGMHVIRAELAVTPEQQAMGMMLRTEMPGNEGMLFVNDDAGVRCFWMRNTLIPLSIAFIADDGTIVNVADMAPRSEASHCSAKPVRFALEMKQGWFARHGVGPGTRLRGAPFKAP